MTFDQHVVTSTDGPNVKLWHSADGEMPSKVETVIYYNSRKLPDRKLPDVLANPSTQKETLL